MIKVSFIDLQPFRASLEQANGTDKGSLLRWWLIVCVNLAQLMAPRCLVKTVLEISVKMFLGGLGLTFKWKGWAKQTAFYNVVGAHPISWRPWEIRLRFPEGGGFCQLPLELNCNSSLGLLPADCDLPTTNLFLFHTHPPLLNLLVLFLWEKPDSLPYWVSIPILFTTKSSKFIMSFASILSRWCAC